tara:strand:- start:2676 stop:4937 length:2262 start_codon:yes stop_codon:yes gene_type:complete
MSTDRVVIVEANLDQYLASAVPADVLLQADEPLRPGSRLTARVARGIFEDQVLSRALDVAARRLKKSGDGFYTISSAGHENNAVLGTLLRTNDPALLHYRSGALMMSRQRQLPGATPLWDTLLSFCASSEDPVSGGRHKVWGSAEAWVPPQTSTIASHLPKAVGLAFALGRARKLEVLAGTDFADHPPGDAIVLCSFGDASANHATALTAINAARYAKRKDNPTPILFLCEDNQRGISVATPRRWIQDSFSNLTELNFFEAKGDLDEVYDQCALAVQTCRVTHSPVFLRLSTVRLWGHAGSDVETSYRTLDEIAATEAKDPILRNARRLIESGAATPEQLRALIADTRERVAEAEAHAAARPRLVAIEDIMEPLAPDEPELWRVIATEAISDDVRRDVFGRRLPEEETSATRRTLGAHINHALHDGMIQHPEMLLFGEDVGRKGGVYGITKDLQSNFGQARCFDTLLDETTILGIAQGAAHVGLLPVPEIQYLAYLHNAIDQLRGEACSLQFFSNGQFENPMVVRIAGLGYQKGFGGHFHNDNSLGALREIPGLAIACPARGDDAARMLRGALAMASTSGRVVVMLEPIALYHTRDLHEDGDGLWLSDYPVPNGDTDSVLLPGDVGVHHPDHTDLLIVSYANGLWMSLRAAKQLEDQHGLKCRVIDARWLAPLPHAAIRQHAADCDAVLVVDECRATGAGIADAVVANLAEDGFGKPLRSVRSADTYIPLGAAANLALIQEHDIVRAALEVPR